MLPEDIWITLIDYLSWGSILNLRVSSQELREVVSTSSRFRTCRININIQNLDEALKFIQANNIKPSAIKLQDATFVMNSLNQFNFSKEKYRSKFGQRSLKSLLKIEKGIQQSKLEYYHFHIEIFKKKIRQYKKYLLERILTTAEFPPSSEIIIEGTQLNPCTLLVIQSNPLANPHLMANFLIRFKSISLINSNITEDQLTSLMAKIKRSKLESLTILEQENSERCKCNQDRNFANNHILSKIHASELGAAAANVEKLSLYLTLLKSQSVEWVIWWFYRSFSQTLEAKLKNNKEPNPQLQPTKITHIHEFHFSIHCSELEPIGHNGEISRIVEIVSSLPKRPKGCRRTIHIDVQHAICRYITCPQVNYLPPPDFTCRNECPAKSSSTEYRMDREDDHFIVTQTLRESI